MLVRSSAVRLNDSPSDGLEGRRSRSVDNLPIVPVGILAAALVFLYRSIVRDMAVQWWQDPNYSHGFLVPLFAGYVCWQRRKELAANALAGGGLGFVLLLLGVAMLVVGVAGAENFLMRSSLVVILCGLVLFHGGVHT